jgi:beta-lactamase class A
LKKLNKRTYIHQNLYLSIPHMLKKIFLTLVLLAAISVSGFGQFLEGDKIPFEFPDYAVKPLRSLVDARLQAALVMKVNANPKWKALAAQKKLAVGLVDLRDPYAPKFARVNGNTMMYAASLPKIAILLAAMDAMENGELMETKEVWDDLRLMISKSNNQASTRMIDRLGYQKIENVLTDPKYALYDEEYGGGLWVGKRYAASGARHPDPIKGLSHAATVSQVCRFYYLMLYGQLVSHDRSMQMLDIMEDPALHHKFVNTLDRIAPNARLFRKSGSWQNFHSDSILVWGSKDRRYILVALTEDPEGELIMRQLVVAVEDVMKRTR